MYLILNYWKYYHDLRAVSNGLWEHKGGNDAEDWYSADGLLISKMG